MTIFRFGGRKLATNASTALTRLLSHPQTKRLTLLQAVCERWPGDPFVIEASNKAGGKTRERKSWDLICCATCIRGERLRPIGYQARSGYEPVRFTEAGARPWWRYRKR